jgi:hypothetical protein
MHLYNITDLSGVSTTSQTRKKKILGDVKRARRQRTLATTAVVAVVMVAVILGVIFLYHPQSPDPLIGTPIPASLYNQITGVSSTTLATVGSGQGATGLTSEKGSSLTVGGKPEMLYIGAEYCPFCAAERWAMTVALSRFGTFTGLTYMESSSTDAFANTPTFSFRNAIYTSNYLSFVSVETQDRNHGTLQTPTSQEQSFMNSYDSAQNIPFVDIGNQTGNQYVTLNGGSQYKPSVLSGLNWTQIASQLNDPNTAVAKAVDGGANYLITAICKIDGENPATLCSQSYPGLTMAAYTVNNMPPTFSPNLINTSASRPWFLSWRNSLLRIW